MSKTVFVTGATGFIAQHIVKLLVSKGYNVVGTVRSELKGDSLKNELEDGKFKYEVVADMQKEGAFDEAIRNNPDVTILIHTASPFFYDTGNPEADLIIPAIKGTENIFKAVKKAGTQIERAVVTSSDAAIYSAEDEQNAKLSFNESSWNDISYEDAVKDPIYAYYGAKSFAEKIAWKFVKEELPHIKLTTVNPVYVFGPQAFDSQVGKTLNTSNELIKGLLELGSSEATFSNDKGGYIDVRDVSKAHLAAFELDSVVGKRLFVTNGQFSTQMILDIIHKNLPQFKNVVPKGNPGTGEEDIKTLAKADNQTTRGLLQFKFNSLETVVVDTIKQYLQVHKNFESESISHS